MKLLIAEDESEPARALRVILERGGYAVDLAVDGGEALRCALTGDYDGILLDVMMPVLDGLGVLARLRGAGVSTPVLMLTAKSQTCDKVAGLDAGADDYLGKPFSMDELLARVRALTRRQAPLLPDVLRAGNLALDRATFTLSAGEASIRLSRREFQLLELLLQNQGRYLSGERLLARVWGADSEAGDSVLWVYLSYLRKKLAGVGADMEIRSARGLGYRLEAKTP